MTDPSARGGPPREVVDIVTSSSFAQLSTLNRLGQPITDALLPVPGPDHRTIDFGTGLAYPTKADRARRHPRVGILFTGPGGPDSPVAVITAHAAVRDRDLQANTDRWVAAYRDTWLSPDALDRDWERAVCYFVRVFISCTPTRAAWWPSGDLDSDPLRWEAPAGAPIPDSDPEPDGPRTAGPRSDGPDWRAESRRVIGRALPPPVLTTVGPDGHPLPVPTRSVTPCDSGFRVELASAVPWFAGGPACLSFEADRADPPGVGGNFLGRAEPPSAEGPDAGDAAVVFTVDRALPPNCRAVAYRRNPADHLFQPRDIQDFLMSRLHRELDRRGAEMPVIRGLDLSGRARPDSPEQQPARRPDPPTRAR